MEIEIRWSSFIEFVGTWLEPGFNSDHQAHGLFHLCCPEEAAKSCLSCGGGWSPSGARTLGGWSSPSIPLSRARLPWCLHAQRCPFLILGSYFVIDGLKPCFKCFSLWKKVFSHRRHSCHHFIDLTLRNPLWHGLTKMLVSLLTVLSFCLELAASSEL